MQTDYTIHSKSRGIAIVLALFLGGFGVHKFYLGRIGAGILYLLIAWTFIPVFLSFIDVLFLVIRGERQFNIKYNNHY